jgi:hypothetical protein
MPLIETEMGKGVVAWARGEYEKGSKDAMVLWMALYSGMTPLMEASFKGNIGVIRALCNNGANPTLTNELGLTALQIAELRSFNHVVSELQIHIAAWQATSGKPVAGVASVVSTDDVKPAPSMWSFWSWGAPCCAAETNTQLEVTSNIPMEVPGLKA